jgi:putative hemolysin
MPIQLRQLPRIQESNPLSPPKPFDYSFFVETAPTEEIVEGRYVARFAHTPEEIDAVLSLRFKIFNLELNEGLDVSFITERDEDEFDLTCHHLIIVERETSEVVGTYRLRTFEMAQNVDGFYSSGEFQLEDLPVQVLRQSLEIGRACIAREHRNTRVLSLLWKGLAMYLLKTKKRYLFGCCSLSSQDCAQGLHVSRQLKQQGYFHETLIVAPRAECACQAEDVQIDSVENQIELPKLFGTYLRIGAKICGEPVIDRQFKTIDFFVIFDVTTMVEKYYKMFFSQFERDVKMNH